MLCRIYLAALATRSTLSSVVYGVALDIAVGCGDDLIRQSNLCSLDLLKGSLASTLGYEHECRVHAPLWSGIDSFGHSDAAVLETDDLFARSGIGYGLGKNREWVLLVLLAMMSNAPSTMP